MCSFVYNIVGDNMQHDQWKQPTPQEEDPYERGFADKLYENYIGQAPQYETAPAPQPMCPASQAQPQAKKRSGFRIFVRLILVLLLLFAGILVFLHFYAEQPTGSENGHADGISTILIVGTDKSGLNTDTLMLLNVNRDEGRLSLMSIPRDTKVNSSYTPHKINGAYAANGGGEEGMYWLCDYVRQCVGFRPDGYILVDLDCFMELVDLFGGVEFNVPMEMHYEDPGQDLYIHLQPGLQTLDGEDAMGVVRFRKGYSMQDLERVNVQRDFFMAALSQWKSIGNVLKLPSALDILDEYCMTDLSTRNLLWLAESFLLCGTDDMMMTTIPNTLGSTYVYIKADNDYLELINTYFNPYRSKVTFDDLNIAN